MLGWMPIVTLPVLSRCSPLGRSTQLSRAALCYTTGTLFLIYDEHVKHFHAAWHLCVISGSACHFIGILLFVVRGGI